MNSQTESSAGRESMKFQSESNEGHKPMTQTESNEGRQPTHAHTDVIVAGHICLDLIPSLPNGDFGSMFVPGKLVNVGPAVAATGGAVSNTGIALHRLGVPTKLMGKIGDDLFGKCVTELLSGYGSELTEHMIVEKGGLTSYTVVVSPPGADRVFLHCTGANDTFRAADVDPSQLAGARLFHFGYPPLMRRMYADSGTELSRLLRGAKASGLTTSLDMARPDPDSEAGRTDWRPILTAVLPQVDLFMPSLEELLFMLDRDRYDRMAALYGAEHLLAEADGALLRSLADEMLRMGAAVAAIKLGGHGLYVRTTADADRFAAAGACAPAFTEAWRDRELLAPCFDVRVTGTTGAGDCTIAGFLNGVLRGMAPEAAMTAAVAVGACNVERPDATSGVPAWSELERRIAAGWSRKPVGLRLDGFRPVPSGGDLLAGPADRILLF